MKPSGCVAGRAYTLFIYFITSTIWCVTHNRARLQFKRVLTDNPPSLGRGWLHHRGLRTLLFSNSGVGSFTSHKNKSHESTALSMINARESIDREHTCIQAKISPRKTKDELTKYQNEQKLMSNSLLNLNLLSLVGIYPPEQSLHIMGIQECGFRIELEFISWIADSLTCILDSKAQDFGLHKQKYPGFRNLLRGIQLESNTVLDCLFTWGDTMARYNSFWPVWILTPSNRGPRSSINISFGSFALLLCRSLLPIGLLSFPIAPFRLLE